jgi:arsenate reductase
MIRIFHNPRCSKSREALQMLLERGEALEIIDYLKTPPDATELEHILALLGIEPIDLMRHKEPEFLELHLDDPALNRKQLIDAMVRHPRLIERPIAMDGTRAVIGRPPERVLELLHSR